MAKRKSKKEPPPQIPVLGELFEETEADIVKALLEVEPEGEVILYIDSAGGSVYSALAISTLLRYRRLRATAIVIGECSSSALLIFAACARRIVSCRSIFLFHRIRWRGEKDVRSEEATNWASHFQWLELEMDRYQAELFGIAPERMQPWIEQGRFVLGPELVELGLAELMD